VTDETLGTDSPANYQPAPKVAMSVAVRPILKGVVYAIARPELKHFMQPEAVAKVAQQISVLLSEVIGVSGGTVERINEYELIGYFLDPADMVTGLPSIWKQFRSAVLRIENVEACTLTLSGHVGTVYVEEFAKGDRRTFKTSGESVNLTQQIGKYIPDNRIWVTQSALSYAQKKGLGTAFHQVPGQLPEAPGEQIFEWRTAVAASTPGKESAKTQGTGLQWLSSVGDLVKGWAVNLGKLTLKLGLAVLILFGLWHLAGTFVLEQMRIRGIRVPGDAKTGTAGGSKGKGPAKTGAESKGKDKSATNRKNDGRKGDSERKRLRDGDRKKQGDLKKATDTAEPTSPPASNGPVGKKGPSAEESSTTGSPTNPTGENAIPKNGSTNGIGPGQDDTSTSGGSTGEGNTGNGSTGSTNSAGSGAATTGSTTAGNTATTGTTGTAGPGSG